MIVVSNQVPMNQVKKYLKVNKSYIKVKLSKGKISTGLYVKDTDRHV